MSGNVDPVILQLEAKLGDYNSQVAGAANATEKNLQRIATSASTTEKALGQSFNNARISQQIMMRAGKGMADQYAASGLSMQMFTTHLGELSEAAVFAGGSMGKLGEFLGSGWGIAAVLAANVLLPLIANLFKTGDGVDELVTKLKEHFEKTQASDRANAIFSRTIEGNTQAVEDNRKAVAGLNLVQDTAAEKALKAALETQKNTIITEKDTLAKLNNAKATLAQISANGLTGNPDAPEAALIQAQDRVKQIEADLAKVRANLAQDQANVISGTAAVSVEKGMQTAEQTLNKLYDKRIADAEALAIKEGKVGDELTRQTKEIEKQRTAALANLKNTGSHVSNAYTGGELSFAQAQAIAEAAGLKVNSGYRSPARQAQLYNDPSVNRPGNPVARPGTSAHNGANGMWALDIQLGPGITPELLRKVFAAQGVTLTKILPEAGHLHIEGKRDQADVEADKAAAAAQKEAEQETKQYETEANRLAVEQEIAQLREGGDALGKEIADQLQSNFDIESKFPQKAGETNDQYRARLKILKDIANATIAAKYADQGTLVPKGLDNELKKSMHDYVDGQNRAAEELAHKQQEQVRTLAGLYEDLFTGGTKNIWQDFKHTGLQVIAEVLARFTVGNLLGGGKVSLGDALIGAVGHVLPGFGSSSSSTHLYSTPGFDSGGSMLIGGNGGTDQNMLSLNGSPMARVSSGEVLSITNPRLARPASSQPSVVRIEVAEGQLFEPRVAQISGNVSVQVVKASAPALTQAAVSETFRQSSRPRM